MQKLPIGISSFAELRKENCVYVDKTKHAYTLLKNNRRTFLSRPRRFGKSLFLSTLEAALKGKKELFDDLWIASSDYSWASYEVIKLNLSELDLGSVRDFRSSLKEKLIEIGKRNGIVVKETLPLNALFRSLISNLAEKNPNNQVAILIDEYDHPILHTLHKLDFVQNCCLEKIRN